MDIIRKCKDDATKVSFWAECACELLITVVLMTMVSLVIVTNDERLYKETSTHFGLFVMGFVFMALEAYGPIACLINPMVSFSLFLAQKISLLRFIINTILNLVGTTAGVWFGYCLTPENKRGSFKPLVPSEHLTSIQSVGIEAFLSFNLIFVVLSCHGREVNKPHPALPNFAIALALALGLWAAGTHTAGLMNPIIALGPAQLSGDFTRHWVYWAGPFIGGPLAVPVYKLLAKGKNYGNVVPLEKSSEQKIVPQRGSALNERAENLEIP